MEIRKVQEMGGGTLLISLPKDWARANKVTKGSSVTIEVKGRDFLAIYPFQKDEEAKEVQIQYDSRYSQSITNQITGAYLLGFDIIRIWSKSKIGYSDRESIFQIVKQLSGLETIEEDDVSVTLQFVIRPAALDPSKIFRRMHVISKNMFEDALTALRDQDERLADLVVDRDEEVNRLYFLLVRIIRSASQDPKLATDYRLNSIDCLDYRVAANILEAIGDDSVDLAESITHLMKHSLTSNQSEMLKNLVVLIGSSQTKAVEIFLSKRTDSVGEVIRHFNEIETLLKNVEVEFLPRLSEELSIFSRFISSIRKISKAHVDITDLVVPTYPMVK
ncbi:MAG: phosphate uptake regulator PhoU [Thaumarchaeota archaeon]|nr:phosphate uptake regulator PhoU [Nitrososphaerota archaeon]